MRPSLSLSFAYQQLFNAAGCVFLCDVFTHNLDCLTAQHTGINSSPAQHQTFNIGPLTWLYDENYYQISQNHLSSVTYHY